ncbi:SRPBCC family protein [Terrabacter sp. 2RAF25]|uniref:SRPBCC family protein n=1 Tax=Terrabacter sp. 2RAF25 TaxID=3232998 RepID=UPI003F97DCBB
MARFTVTVETELPAEEAWRRLFDLRAHTRAIPLTTLRGEVLTADGLRAGSRFVARTAVGPVGFDDRMVVDEIVPPQSGGAGSTRIRKEGNVVRGQIDVVVAPTAGGSRVEWEQVIRVRPLPALLDPVVALVARLAYATTIRRLLRG